MGVRVPLSRSLPGPTASTIASWGFSCTVSGRKRPLFVCSERSMDLTSTRSPSGRMLVFALVAVSAICWFLLIIYGRWLAALPMERGQLSKLAHRVLIINEVQIVDKGMEAGI